MSTEKLIAVDFGSSQIRTLAAEVLGDNSLRVLSAESKRADDVKYGIIEQSSGAAYKTAELIKLLHNSAKISPRIDRFCTSVNARSMKLETASYTKDFKKPELITREIIDKMALACEKELVTDEIEIYDIIPVIYVVDGEEVEHPEGKSARSITAHYHVIKGSSRIKANLHKCFDRIYGLSPESYPHLSIEALALAATEEDDRKEGCAIIDFGATTTSLGIYRNDIIQDILIVPLGGLHITRDIEETGISEAHAEKLKCMKGSAKESYIEKSVQIQVPSKNAGDDPVKITTRFLATIIEARLEEMLEPIFEMIESYNGELLRGIFITGNGSKLDKLQEYIFERTGLETRYGDHSGWLSSDTPDEYRDIQYAQLIGTVLLAHDYRLSHLPEVEEQAKKKPGGPGKSIKERFAQNFIRFFEDDKVLQE